MLSGVIERRPWTIIVAWLIVVALLAQYAASINEVVETETESFLPEHVESIRAERALENLTRQAGVQSEGNADYLVLVHGVPVSLESYEKLRGPYQSLREEYNIYSWIDIVEGVRQNISSGALQALNASQAIIAGMLALNQQYQNLTASINMTTQLVQGASTAYTMLASNLHALEGNVTQLEGAATLILASCNELLPLTVKTYFDVVRAEALLEAYTSAYQNGTLTQQDIATVVALSNLTMAGVNPLSPELVATVFQLVQQHGGPTQFNNAVAASIASLVAYQVLNQTAQPTPQLLLAMNVTLQLWQSKVVERGDDRQVILGAPSPVEGQLALLQNLSGLAETLKSELAAGVAQALAARLPESASQNILLIAQLASQADCNVTSENLTLEAVRVILEGAGLPGELAGQLATAVLEGQLTSELIARAAVGMVASNLPPGAQVPQEMLDALAGLLAWADPEASGLLASPEQSLRAATALVLAQAGLPLEQAWQVADTPGSVEEAALIVLKRLAPQMGGNESLALVSALGSRGLLGASEGDLLAAAPGIIAELMGSDPRMTPEMAELVGEYSVRVYEGELGLEEAADRIAVGMLEQVFPDIVEEMRGLMVERELNGFLVAFRPPEGASTEDAIRMLRQLRDALRATLETAGYAGVEVVAGGDQLMSHEMREAAVRDIERSDRISMILVLIVMALVLESLAAVFLPFIGIGFGLATSLALAYFLAKAGVIEVTTHSRTIMYTTGLGLGIDYAVYVSKRFREAASRGLPSRRAAAEAFRLSWRPVIAGATTAMIGFGSMMLARGFPFIESIGSNVPLTIFMVMLASITFIPALLAYVGEKRWFWWPRHPTNAKSNGGLARRVLSPVARVPAVFLAVAIVLGVAGFAVVSSYEGSYDITLNLPRGTESYRAVEMINEYYDPGVLYPAIIVLGDPSKADQVKQAVETLECISKVVDARGLEGKVLYAYMNVNPTSSEGVRCAELIREKVHNVDPNGLVGGMSAVFLDLRDEINSVFYGRVYPVAITLMFLTMLVAYGGVLTALSAVLGVVLAAYAGSALTILYYEHIAGTPVLWYLPVVVFTAILGVGMDYNSFYLARAREECARACSREGVLESLAKGTVVVLGLAVIMASAYLGIAASSIPGLQSMGIALMLGVLLAGLNAGVLLTPPLLALLGARAWWPWKPGKRGRVVRGES